MTLPPYSQQVFWKDYEIDTPTFDLTPIEKPDMSPLLFHMTGRNAILSILQGEGAPDELPTAHGKTVSILNSFSPVCKNCRP